jgi:hypothetical protein
MNNPPTRNLLTSSIATYRMKKGTCGRRIMSNCTLWLETHGKIIRFVWEYHRLCNRTWGTDVRLSVHTQRTFPWRSTHSPTPYLPYAPAPSSWFPSPVTAHYTQCTPPAPLTCLANARPFSSLWTAADLHSSATSNLAIFSLCMDTRWHCELATLNFWSRYPTYT